MPALHGADPGTRGVGDDDTRVTQYIILAGLATLLIAMIVVVVASLSGSTPATSADDAALRRLPPYWTVHRGESYSSIAEKTGLSVDQLETFNPYTNPATIVPGQRLKLRLHPPPPPPKPKGPKFWTVRTGDSFGSIAAKTGHNINKLQQLNPKRRPTMLQPGDRIRLRR
ncbi:MAG: LysM peptidoglycan-binding domain-containing protein [Actinobacteria bacterium]|nr:LysM peptidoglycan-binding domain-containing protein [Actinomycetota bacterium]